MKAKVADHAATVERLRATLRLTEKRAELAEHAGSRNKVALARARQEIGALKVRVCELEAELAVMLTADGRRAS
jgi:hypothetical protein